MWLSTETARSPAPGSPAPPAAGRTARRAAAAAALGCLAMLVAFAALAWTAASGKSATQDESYHALAGWLHRWHHDDRFDSEDPPLWNTWAALLNGPDALRANPRALDVSHLPLDTGSEFIFTVDTLYRTPGNDAIAFLRRARAMMLLIGLALGAAIAALAWTLARAGGAGPAAAAVAALTACGLYCLDPNFLAHAPLVKNDVSAAAAMLAVAAALWAVGRRISLLRVAALGLAGGLALAVKFSGIGIVLIGLGLLATRALLPWPWPIGKRWIERRPARLAAALAVGAGVVAIALAVLWAAYGWRFDPAPQPASAMPLAPVLQRLAERTWQSHQPGVAATPPAPTPAELRSAVVPWAARGVAAAAKHRLLPQAFCAGLLFTEQSALVRPAFLCGRFSRTGWWWYFPFAMAVKTPTATLALAALAAIVGAAAIGVVRLQRRARRPTVSAMAPSPGNPGEGRGEGDFERKTILAIPNHPHPSPFAGGRQFRSLLPDYRERGPGASSARWTHICLLLPAALYLAAAMTSNLNLGLRHVLPIYPLLYIAIALAAAKWWTQRPRTTLVLLLLTAAGLTTETLAAYPNFIPFFNALAGGSRGGLKLLSDSNLDWGQDLPLLAQWQRSHPQVRLYLAYFGTADPAYYGIHYTNLPAGYQLGPPPGRIDSPGVIAISATLLQGTYDRDRSGGSLYGWLAGRRPIAVLGGSIYLFGMGH